MLGQPISMLIPQVLGFRLTGTMLEGATATDLVLTITETAAQARRRRQVRRVLRRRARAPDDRRSRDARQHVPRVRRDDRDLPDRRDDARLPAADGRDASRVELVEAYAKAQGLFRNAGRSRSDVLGDDRARSRDGRAEPRRAEAAAGSRVAEAGEERIPDGAAARCMASSSKKGAEAGGSAHVSAQRTRRR